MNSINMISKLENISKELKKKILKISFEKKAHHIGSCLSCIDILTTLYFGFMNVNKKNINNNDKFIMSKGHASLSYYLVLMKKNFFSENFLIKEYLSDNGKLGGHPDTNLKKGIDFCISFISSAAKLGESSSIVSITASLSS